MIRAAFTATPAWWTLIALVLFPGLLAWSQPAVAQPGAARAALLVANNQGTDDDAPLRHTHQDAARMADALTDVGRFDAAQVALDTDATGAAVLAALDKLIASPQSLEVFVFYYSGHADAGALRMDGGRLPLDTLMQKIERVPATLRLIILDACQSGAAARPKGVSPGESFDVRVRPDLAAGQVLIASSAADEASFESDHHQGALFTLHWTTGMRGAADLNNDGRVSLTEAYDYAYARTINATLLAAAGPQHPTYKWDLAGHKDPTMAWLNTGSTLNIKAQDDARYLVFDPTERHLLAEIPMLTGDVRRIALPPGRYLIKRRTSDGLAVASVKLKQGDDQQLYDHQMHPVPLVQLSSKGTLGQRWLTASMGQYASHLGAVGHLQGTFGLEWEDDRWLWHADLALSTGTTTISDLETRLSWGGATFSPMWTWRPGQTALRVGPSVGALVLHQDTQARPPRWAVGGLFGVRTRFDLPLGDAVALLFQADIQSLLTQSQNTDISAVADFGPMSLSPWISYQAGLRVTF